MKIKKIIDIATLSLLFWFAAITISAVKAETFPSFPMAFWGSVTVDGNSAPVGTVVRAYYGTTLAGQIVVQEAGIYGYTEATKQKLLVAEGVGQITFKFQQNSLNGGAETDGTTLQTYAAFESGITKNFNLAFILSAPPASSPPPTQTTSGGSGGGGGGGGGSYTPPLASIKGDINNDKKVDKYDFALIMANWGKTGSNSSDLNGDNKVDKYDFALLMLNWSK